MAKGKKQTKRNNKRQQKQQEKKRKVPFWFQIGIILLSGILLSGIIFLIAHNVKKSEDQQNTESKESYTVTFAYQDGTVIDTKTVEEGNGVYPPIPKTDDVFRGWSSAINDVRSDIEVHPLFYTITDDENLFYFNSLYVKEGEEFTIDITLSGKVKLSKAKLTISYDPEVMEYLSADAADFCEVNEGKEGELVLDLISKTPLKEKTMLSGITFKAKEKDVLSTQIDLSCKNAEVIEAGKASPATVSTINNKIYYLQEVD